jgi:hypothetical protein
MDRLSPYKEYNAIYFEKKMIDCINYIQEIISRYSGMCLTVNKDIPVYVVWIQFLNGPSDVCTLTFKCCVLSMALQPFIASWPLFILLILYIVGRTRWTGISPSQGLDLYTEQHKHRINEHRHPCLEWDSNPRPQRANTAHALNRAVTVIG